VVVQEENVSGHYKTGKVLLTTTAKMKMWKLFDIPLVADAPEETLNMPLKK